ncbi:MAG: hypothetical protein PHS24_04375 [Bacilli bacterium]|nr:hypothetical protein [Bacilli bacterium]
MFRVKTALNLIINNKLFSAILIILMLATVFILNSFILFLYNLTFEYNISKNSRDLYFVSADRIFSAEYEALKDVDKIYQLHDDYCVINNNINAYLLIIDNEIYSYFDIPIAKGRWYKENSEILEIVVSKETNYNINDIVNLRNEDHIVQAQVVGILDNEFLFFDMSRGSTSPQLEMIFKWRTSGNNGSIIISNRNLEGTEIINNNRNCFIKFKDDISEESLEENLLLLNNQAICVNSMDYIMNASYNLLKERLLVALPIIILGTIITAITFIIIILLILQKTSNEFSLFYLVGCKNKDISLIIIYYNVIISLLIFILNQVLSNYYINPFNIELQTINNIFNLFSSIIILIIFNCSILLLTFFNYKIKNLKEILIRRNQ